MSQDARAFNWDSIGIIIKTLADPAAGSKPTDMAATTKRTFLYGFGFNLLTSAVANNRQAIADIRFDATNVHLYVPATGTQAASLTHQYEWTVGIAAGTEVLTGTQHMIGLGYTPIELPIGSMIVLSVYLQDLTGGTGDNPTATRVFLKEVPA